MSAANHTAADQHADDLERLIVSLGEGELRANLASWYASDALDLLAVLRARAAAADNLAAALREIIALRLGTSTVSFEERMRATMIARAQVIAREALAAYAAAVGEKQSRSGPRDV